MDKKTITLVHKGFLCKGTATLNLLDGSQWFIEMTPWTTDSDHRNDIVKGVNDGQFGCESFESAIVNVFDLYNKEKHCMEQPYQDYNRSEFFSAEQLENAKKGIHIYDSRRDD